jgi:quinol monooxygenase YgiN
MAVVVVTRLRLRSHDVLDAFFAAAVALLEQAKASPGVLRTDVLAEAEDTWWTCTSWTDRASMESFVTTDPHHASMGQLDGWCDEASFVDWEQDDGELPTWPAAHARLVADGRSSSLSDPSPANEPRSFPPPVLDAG